MHVFMKPQSSPLSKGHATSTYTETVPGSRDATYSPPLTSSLHSRNSATSAEESAYLQQAAILKWARLCFALFTAGVSISTVAVLSHLLRSYNDTVMPGQYYLVLWPLNTDVRPSLSILIPAALAAIGAILYIAFAIVPSPRSRFLTQNYLFAFLSAAGLLMSIIAVGYNLTIEHNVPTSGRETVSSWTCSMYNNARTFVGDAQSLQLDVAMDPILPNGFALMCVESQVARWMVVGLLILQAFSLAVAAIGLSAEKKISRVRYSRFQEKSTFA